MGAFALIEEKQYEAFCTLYEESAHLRAERAELAALMPGNYAIALLGAGRYEAAAAFCRRQIEKDRSGARDRSSSASFIALGIAYLASGVTLRLLSIPESTLMPLIAVFCAVGAYGTTNTPFSLIQLAFFGIIGLLMKVYNYPIAPLVLGMLVGNTADTCLRRALTQYASNLGGMILRPFGLVVMALLIVVFILSIRSDKKSKAASKEHAEEG